MRTRREVTAIVSELCSRIALLFPQDKIETILFGSYARGDADSGVLLLLSYMTCAMQFPILLGFQCNVEVYVKAHRSGVPGAGEGGAAPKIFCRASNSLPTSMGLPKCPFIPADSTR